MKDVVRYNKVSAILRREWERVNAEMVLVEREQDYESLVPLLMLRDSLNGIWIALGSEVEVCVDGGVHGEQESATDAVGPTSGSAFPSRHSGHTLRDELDSESVGPW